ncbi:hypothetical protein MASR2M69_06510 [Bacteroidota bacterium]
MIFCRRCLSVYGRRERFFENENHLKAYFYKSLRNNTIKRIVRSKKGVNLENIGSKESDDLFEKIVGNRVQQRAVSFNFTAA